MNIYGLLIGIGIVIGIELIKRINKDITYLNILFLLLSTLIGARVLFLLHNIEEIKNGLINPFAIWDGGLAFYGAISGLILSLLVISKIKKIKIFNLFDSVFLFLPLIHAIGRIGNFFNYELYGKPTDLPWGIFIPQEFRQPNLINYTHFHPVFIYESILNIFNFLILLILRKKVKRDGVITGIYLINYGIIRVLMNTLRVDKEYFFNLETSDIFSVIFILSGILIILITMKNTHIKDLIAKFISRVLTLSLLLFAVISVLLNSDSSLNTKIFLFLFTFLIPLSFIFLLKALGITSDLNVTKREERPRLFIPMAICFLISLIIAIKSSSDILITVYTSLFSSFLLGFLVTLFWKISYHMIWTTLAIFFIIISWQIPQLYYLIVLLPFIGWSRLQLKRHTLPQVIAGFVLTLTSILLVLTFIKF